MRLRRLSAVFWATCTLAFIFILYVVTDLTFKSPSIRPAMPSLQDNAVSQIVNNPQVQRDVNNRIEEEEKNAVVLKEPPAQVGKGPHEKIPVVQEKTHDLLPKITHMSQCPVRMDTVPKTDIQMLTMYERIAFDDVDGGAWKQGWKVEYDEKQWSRANKLKVFIVPYSHNDPGWLETFEDYYAKKTKVIFYNMVLKLTEVPGRKFIWAETCFLSLWWSLDATEAEKAAFKKLLKSGNIEIVTGGWVMNDEANSHWLSIAQQLTTGHQWLLDNVQYIPKNHWSIDPFGYSSTQPYLLKLAGFENSIIQRVHYRIKKELAMNRELEFKWRQLWDGIGKTDMFTHVMPFFRYDVLNTCGPDPMSPENDVKCPLYYQARKIIQKNVQERAFLILDQWRKKAQLYKSNVLFVPLGDHFRYDHANEWDNQYRNYESLIDYINNNDVWNTEVQFGTLEDYFTALHAEVKMSEFPTLSGDFFTYADRNQHYWSGYYTSRPFYKRMDRVLLAYVRAAEIISSQSAVSGAVSRVRALQLRELVEQARRALALFQHHDGVTGTSRDEVREDYANKMLQAIKHSQMAIQKAAYYLLGEPQIQDKTLDDIYFDVDDIWRRHDEIPTRITIALDVVSLSRKLVLYNALNFKRTDILTVLVSSPHVEVFDPSGEPIMAQVAPVVGGNKRLAFAANKYQLSFPAIVPALGIAQYTVALRDSMSINKYTSYSRIRLYNADYWNVTVDLPKIFPIEVPPARLEDDVVLSAGNGTKIVCDKNGLLKAAITLDGEVFPLYMDFVKYSSSKEPDNKSDAYLFMPNGPAEVMKHDPYPELVITEGMYKSTLHTALLSPQQVDHLLMISVFDNPSLPQTEVTVCNSLLIDPKVNDLEVAMRLATRLLNNGTFYTDLNGMQMIKRRYLSKLPLQANFYPLGSAAYIQDEQQRLSLLTSTPLGVAALTPGEIQVMQDRRLSKDDNRGVMDNVRTKHIFKIIVENASPCQIRKRPHPSHPSGQLTLGAHVSSQTLLQPLVTMHYTAARDHLAPASTAPSPPSQADVVLASFNAHVSSQTSEGKTMQGVGLTFHRVSLDSCYGNGREIVKQYPIGDGQIQLSDYLDVGSSQVHPSSLSFTRSSPPTSSLSLSLCPMEVSSVFINLTLASLIVNTNMSITSREVEIYNHLEQWRRRQPLAQAGASREHMKLFTFISIHLFCAFMYK